MYKYTIFCTEEQTKKALELGAPIDKDMYAPIIRYEQPWYCIDKEKSFAYHIPTAEQMIGWLRSKGFRFKITEFEEGTLWKVAHGDWFDFSYNDGISPKEATLAAIDAALGYLMSLHHDF